MMPENESSPLPIVMPRSAPARSIWPLIWFLVALVAILLAGWQWLDTRQKLLDIDSLSQEARGAQKQLREQVDALQARLGAVDGKITEFQGQGSALQGLVQDIAQGREAASLLEVEQAITLAGQQLQLAGNVPVALLALQTADARLARLEHPQFLSLRKALAKDIAHLSGQPLVDIAGLSLRLEQVILTIDSLPVLSQGRPALSPETQPDPALLPWWQRSGHAIWLEFKSLVRIQRFDRTEPVLLAPGQDFFLRENIKLRLLNARLALLSHEESIFRDEIKVALDALGRYFELEDKGVVAAQLALRKMLGVDLKIALPSLVETQNALRALRATKEKP